MFNINDADQPASPAEDKNNQEQSQLEPLPWEIKKGLLWGFPATVWMVVRYPAKTLTNTKALSLRGASYFACIIALIVLYGSWLISFYLQYEYVGFWKLPSNLDSFNSLLSTIATGAISIPFHLLASEIIPTFILYLLCRLLSPTTQLIDIVVIVCYCYSINILYLVPNSGYILAGILQIIYIATIISSKYNLSRPFSLLFGVAFIATGDIVGNLLRMVK